MTPDGLAAYIASFHVAAKAVYIKIVYIGEVNGTKVAELMAGIDDINASYPAVKEISLYINSFGGDMEAGYIGGQAVRGSRIPIKTINAAMTGSAAHRRP